MTRVTKNRFSLSTPRSQRPFAALLTTLGLLMAVSPLAAEIPISSQVSDSSMAPNLRIADGRLALTLDEAIATALERNLSLVVQRYGISESGLRLDQARAIFDTNLGLNLSTFEETSPSTSNLDGADIQVSEQQRWDFTVSRLVPSGGTASVLFNNSRFSSNSTFSTLNPAFRSDFDLNFNQPLLRDKGRLATERNIKIARTNLEISQEVFEQQVTQLLQEVEDAYWTLVEAKAQLEVDAESLSLAKQLHDQNRVRVEVGTLAPLDLVQSEAGIATREEAIIRSEAAVGDGEDRLRQLLNLHGGDVWDLTIGPETEAEREVVEINVDQSIAQALAGRPELRQKRLDQQNRSLDTEYFRNQRKPRADLNVRYGVNGIGGDLTERNFFTGEILRQAPGDYNDALSQLGDGNFDGWSVGLNLSYPIGNTAGKAHLALAEVSHERGAAELRDLELGVETEVRRLVRFVRTAAQARQSAKVSRRLAEKNLEAEQKRYDNGMSTSYQVLEIQEDLTAARSREVNAITGYRRALVQYYRATGQLIEQNGVEIVDSVEPSEAM